MVDRKERRINAYQILDNLTRMFIAYFINKLNDKGINFADRTIKDPRYRIKDIFKVYHSNHPFIECGDFCSFPMEIEGELSELNGYKNLPDFFKNVIVPEQNERIEELAKIFLHYKNNKFMFCESGSNDPFICANITDPDTDVSFRGTAGLILSHDYKNKTGLVFDSYYYFLKEECDAK